MAKGRKSSENTLEIILAVIVVIFIFSMIGVLNLQSLSGPISSGESAIEIAEESVEQITEETSEEEGTELISGSSESQTEAEIATEGIVQASGTALAAASSNFEVMPS